jgi:uncharacterized membrane protein
MEIRVHYGHYGSVRHLVVIVGTVAWCRYIGNGVGLAVGALLLVMVVVTLPPSTSFTIELPNFVLPLLATYSFG